MPTDFYWNLDGDYALGEEGDLKDTSFDPLRSTWQEARTRVRSNRYDWKEHKNLGADLEDLLGNINNRVTAEEGRTNIISSLIQEGFIPKRAIKIRYVPISRHRLFFFITIDVLNPATGETKLLKLTLLYDTEEGKAAMI